MRSKQVQPLHVSATQWQESDKEVEITCYTTASQRWNGTGKTVWEESFRTRTFRCPWEEIEILWEQSTMQRGRPLSALPSCGSHQGHGWGELGELLGEMAECLLPWLSPPGTYQTLQQTNWFVRDTESFWGFISVIFSISTREKMNKISHVWATGTEIHCDQSIPSLVTPSSEASPFY